MMGMELMLSNVVLYTKSWISKIEAINPQHAKEEREGHGHTIVVAWSPTFTQLPVHTHTTHTHTHTHQY